MHPDRCISFGKVKGAEAVRDAIAASMMTMPDQLRRSLTWDQGAEMAQHAKLRIDSGLSIYFFTVPIQRTKVKESMRGSIGYMHYRF